MNLAMLLPELPRRRGDHLPPLDYPLIAAVAALFSMGLVMVASASMPVAEGLTSVYFTLQCVRVFTL